MDFKKLLNSEDYKFLYENEHLKDKILFLTLGGSLSYGTNIETSDIDIRGVCLPSMSDLLGITSFDQFEDRKTDTVIYSLPKFMNLITSCNPNIIEMLFCNPSHYIYVSEEGKYLLSKRHEFLTSRAKFTFGGYAHAQLNRLENALVRNGEVLTDEEKQIHVNRSIKNAVRSFEDRHESFLDKLNTYVDKDSDTGEYKIYCDFNFNHLPLGEISSLLREVSDVIKTYNDKVGQCNKKKDDLHLNKHMMHLMRLYLMCYEILSKNDLHTYRPEDERRFLLSIRNGDYRSADGGVKKEFYDILNKLEALCNEAQETTKLPKSVDSKIIYDILTHIYKNTLFK